MRLSWRHALVCGFGLTVLGLCGSLSMLTGRSVHADDSSASPAAESAKTEFVRIRTDRRNRPVAMETAIARYTKSDGAGGTIAVELIGVVHVGEQDYYVTLNDRFSRYDALLYELVAPEGTRVDPEMERGGPVSGLQNGMKDMLGLEFQLDHIDYLQDNFVHADMSPDEFVESMVENEESFVKMFFKMMGSSMAQQGSPGAMSEGDLFAAMFSSDREMKLRQAMARQISGMDAAMVAFSGKEGSTIIHHRNGKCFEILDREIAAGKRNLGVFYGAGHLADMEDRLLEKGFVKQGETEWFIAWRLTRDEEALQGDASDKFEFAEPTADEASAEGAATDANESAPAGDSVQEDPHPTSERTVVPGRGRGHRGGILRRRWRR